MEMVKTNQEVKTRAAVAYLGKDSPWLDAHSTVNGMGKKLPSNVLLDDILLNSSYKILRDKLIEENYFAAWTSSFLVYPEKNGTFKKGKDIFDSYEDDSGRRFKFLGSDIPKEAIGKEGVALYFEYKDVEISGKTVTIRPEEVIVLNNFPQQNGWGKVDEKTRVPLVSTENISEDQKRYLWRIDGAAVRPLARDFRGRGVLADYGPDFAFGVGVASQETAGAAPQVSVADAALQLKPLIRDVNAALGKLSETVKPETLAPIYSLVRALDIKD